MYQPLHIQSEFSSHSRIAHNMRYICSVVVACPLVMGSLLAFLSRYDFVMPYLWICPRLSSVLFSFMLDTSNRPVHSIAPLCTLPRTTRVGGHFALRGTMVECPGKYCALGQYVQGDIVHGGNLALKTKTEINLCVCI